MYIIKFSFFIINLQTLSLNNSFIRKDLYINLQFIII
jgi:hypothetical protein